MESVDLSRGAAEALADNPEFRDIVLALAGAPDEPCAAASAPLAPRVLRAVAARRRFAARVRAFALAAAAAAAAVAVVPAISSAGGGQAGGAGSGAAPALAGRSAAESAAVAALIAAQGEDGSWTPARGGEGLAPAATGLAVLRLAASGDPAAAPALAKAAAWLRAEQNPDGSFGRGEGVSPGLAAPNLALPAAALLRLYGTGGWPELFTPADGAVAAVRARLAAASDAPREGDVWLAAALSLADELDWPDSFSGDLRRTLRRFAVSGDPRFGALSRAGSVSGAHGALASALDAAVL